VNGVNGVTGVRPRVRALLAVLADLAPGRRPVAAAVVAGSAALGSAVGLTAVAAWLISRAAEHPSVVVLGVAVVAVRALGISRGVFRYLERLASHDVALRGAVTVRERLYRRLAEGDPARAAGLRPGELLARVGPDVDLVSDAVVRGVLPVLTAAVVAGATVAALSAALPAAGLVTGAAVLVAGVVAPLLAARAAAAATDVADTTAVAVTAQSQELLDLAAELTVAGRVPARLAAVADADGRRGRALDVAARPAAHAAALQSAAIGLAVAASLLVGARAVATDRLSPVLLAVLALVPMALADVLGPLPAAAGVLVRASLAAQRLQPLLAVAPAAPGPAQPIGTGPARLRAEALACGWPGGPVLVSDLDLDLAGGTVVAVVGPSGCGKSTLLRTLAGVLTPVAGTVSLDGRALADLDQHALRRVVTLTGEDAHLFATTLRDELLVARGDATDADLLAVLDVVGLGGWAAGLPGGLDAPVEPATVSGGERRRLLLARALLVGSRVLLLDEPTEHLDPAAAAQLRQALRRHARATGAAVVLVTHDEEAVAEADDVLRLSRPGAAGIRAGRRARGSERSAAGAG
jgi:ATP-binding cassette subfamily C protein CydC